jgi:adenine deaminase
MFATTDRTKLVEVNLGAADADLVIKNGTHVNVHTGERIEEDIAIAGDRIAVVGDAEDTIGAETDVIDADGKHVVPGLIEGHLHSYHSYINGTEFAKLLLEHGTTACADGFYGQAIVGGKRGAEFAKEEVQQTPLKSIFLVPVLANQQMTTVGIPRGETGVSVAEMREMLEWDDCFGLEEPTYEPVVDQDEAYLDLFQETIDQRKVVTGHAALPSDRELSAFIAAGATTDHEMSTADGALQRARRGMSALSRHGTGLPNLLETTRPVTEDRVDSRFFGASGDVRLPGDLQERGCIDLNVRDAISRGVDPITSIQMATINTAEALRVDQELGSIAPGKVADVVLVDDLAEFEIKTVVASGAVVVEEGELTADIEQPEYPEWATDTIDLGKTITPDEFVVEADGETATVRTIEIPEGAALQTVRGEAELPIEDGAVQPQVEDDIVKVAMLDRLEASGRTGVGFVDGFGLGQGAL